MKRALWRAVVTVATAITASGIETVSAMTPSLLSTPSGQLVYHYSNNIYVRDMATGEINVLIQNAAHGRWSPNGDRIAYLKTVGIERDLYVANADGSGELQVTPTGDELSVDGPAGWLTPNRLVVSVVDADQGQADHPLHNALVSAAVTGGAVTEFVIIDATARLFPGYVDGDGLGHVIFKAGFDRTPTASSSSLIDGIFLSSGGEAIRLTGDDQEAGAPRWSRDRRFIAYSGASPPGSFIRYGLSIMPVTGGSGREILAMNSYGYLTSTWSPSGDHLVVSDGRSLYLVDAQSGAKTTLPLGSHPDWRPSSGATDRSVDGAQVKSAVKQRQSSRPNKVGVRLRAGASEPVRTTTTVTVSFPGTKLALKKVTRDVAANAMPTTVVKPRKRAHAKAIVKAIKHWRSAPRAKKAKLKVKATISVLLVDKAGNTRRITRKVTLK